MSLEEFKNIEDLYKAKTFGTIQNNYNIASFLYLLVISVYIDNRS